MNTLDGLHVYVRRVLREKNLSFSDVERRSGGAISDSYVCSITLGNYGSLTVSKLKALALGLDVSEDEIFAVARGTAEDFEPTFGGSVFARLFRKYQELPAEDQKEVLVLLETINREIDWRYTNAKERPEMLNAVAG